MAVSEPANGKNHPASAGWLRGRRWAAFACLIVLLLGVLSWHVWYRVPDPDPPPIPAAGAEPGVLEVLRTARAKVLNQPSSAAAWGELGMAFFANKFHAPAQPCLAHAERLDPRDPTWPYLQALAWAGMDDIASLAALERALPRCPASDPRHAALRLLLAEKCLEKYELSAAAAHGRAVLERAPDHPRAHLALGLLAQADQDEPSALHHLTQAAASPSARKRVALQLAELHRRWGRDAAAADCVRLAALLPEDLPWEDPFLESAQRFARGPNQRAESTATGPVPTALRFLAQWAGESAEKGAALVPAERVDFAAGEQFLRASVRIYPQVIQGHLSLGQLLILKGDADKARPDQGAAAAAKYQEASVIAQRAVQQQPQQAAGHWLLGLARWRLGHINDALAPLQEAVHLRPENYVFHLHLGDVLGASGRRAEALRHLRWAAEMAPPRDDRPKQALASWTTP